jgi:acyl-coenzyme A thioesterase PaaI-like protein
MKQANSRHCFVCGLENPAGLHLHFYETEPGEVTAQYTVGEQHQGYPGIVHGGIVAAMLDEVAGRVHMGSTDQPRFMFTARLDVRYRKPVPVGKPLRLVGKAGDKKTRMATAKSFMYGPDGDLLAEAEAILINVPESVVDQVDLESLGWKVYPEEATVTGYD